MIAISLLVLLVVAAFAMGGLLLSARSITRLMQPAVLAVVAKWRKPVDSPLFALRCSVAAGFVMCLVSTLASLAFLVGSKRANASCALVLAVLELGAAQCMTSYWGGRIKVALPEPDNDAIAYHMSVITSSQIRAVAWGAAAATMMVGI